MRHDEVDDRDGILPDEDPDDDDLSVDWPEEKDQDDPDEDEDEPSDDSWEPGNPFPEDEDEAALYLEKYRCPTK
jgi:hypothetical protein